MTRRAAILPVLLAFAIAPYFVDLGGSAIWDANEAFYVETPREMIERGDYVSPTFNYEPRLNKPVLSYWIVAGFYQLFGVSVGVQRFPMALAAVVIITGAFFLAWAAGPGDPPGGESGRVEAALWAALGLAAAPRLLMFARRIFIDIYITMFLALALLFFALAERCPGRRRTFLVLMYVSVGLGALTKGPVALVLPAAAFGTYLLVHREPGRLRSMMIPAGVLIVAAIVAPWCVALYQRHGWAPLTQFILGENVARYTAGVGVDAERGPLFYVPVLFGDSFPWSFFLVAAAAGWWTERRVRPAGGRDRRVRALLWLWVAVIVLFFTASVAKQDLYIFPVIPAVAALAGVQIQRSLPAPGPLFRVTVAVLSSALLAAGGGVMWLSGANPAVSALAGVPAAAVALLAGGGAGLVLNAASRLRAALLVSVAAILVVNWLLVTKMLPAFERYRPVPAVSEAIRERMQPGDAVMHYQVALPSMVYYLRRHIDGYIAPEEFVQAMGARPGFGVLRGRDYVSLQAMLPNTCVLGRWPIFEAKLREIISRQPLPELLLISNRCGGSR